MWDAGLGQPQRQHNFEYHHRNPESQDRASALAWNLKPYLYLLILDIQTDVEA